MRFDNYSFPHPILGRYDDIAGNASAELFVDEGDDEDNFVVTVKHSLQNPDIQRLLAERQATYFCEITCSATLFRRVVVGHEPIQVFLIDKNVVRGNVDFLCLVVTTEPIAGYVNSDVHPELAGLASDLDTGDVLAYLGEADFLADIAFKKLKAASSFMEIVEGDKDSGNFDVILDNPKILIRLPKGDYAKYIKPEIGRNEKLASVFQSSVALPALVHALQQLSPRTGKDDYREKPWAKAVEWRIDNELEPLGIVLDEDSVVNVAQTLLGAPVERLLTDLDQKSSESVDDEL